ncbi:uncharacterized protein PAN0_001c0316 [Moesziomyces antarcticus]|uniref:Uncharacterized protein n=1 Tax=Pseudozyma antarctica TaxID=84753 RepID=A0A5C3FEL0_PSEA2|nr:uncharacterized protein PAN0_001c0316 [Moesziomyces antarcticus]GAK62119.1 hypothetical protein PAN0_001c0316 [Moesziomyces antarcticus]SPO42650.1 uncharacterized protein PSANT_00333 [Moesziomyces antarcticus]
MEKLKQHEVLLTTNICLLGILLWIICSHIGALLAVLAVLALLFPELRPGILVTPQQDKSRSRRAWLPHQEDGKHAICNKSRAEFDCRGRTFGIMDANVEHSARAREAKRGRKRFDGLSPEETLASPPRLELLIDLRTYDDQESLVSDRPGSSGYFYDYVTSSESACSNLLRVAPYPRQASFQGRPSKREERAKIVAWLQEVSKEMPSWWLPRTDPAFPQRHKTLLKSNPSAATSAAVYAD